MRRNYILAVIFSALMLIVMHGPAYGLELGGVGGMVNGPYLMDSTQTSMTIMWETSGQGDSEVIYGLECPLSESVKIDEKVRIHEVKLSGLAPETNYFYQVRSQCGSGKAIKSRVFTFKTAVREDSAFSFVVLGDNRTRFWLFKRIMDRAYAERPEFVLNVGDVVTNGLKKRQWHREFFGPAGKLMARVPTYIAIGNHERDTEWFYKYVSYPEPENYYSFDYGNAHFAIIDSNKELGPDSEEYKWLENDLANTQATWNFVAHHHPPYSSDENDYGDTYKGPSTLGEMNTKQLVPLYEKYGVDIVWAGHIHVYERTWPIKNGKVDPENGVIYITTGGAGAPIEDFAPTRSWFTAKVGRDCHYCLVSIQQGDLIMTAYDIHGNLFDFLKLEK